MSAPIAMLTKTTPTDLSPIANHLWQSTLCAAAVWLLTLALKGTTRLYAIGSGWQRR